MTKDPRDESEQQWKKATNKVLADQLVENLEKLLGGKATHWVCIDKKTQHEKIVIEYNHQNKND